MVKPHHVFAFGLLVAVPLLLALLVHPEEGLPVFGKVTMEFPSFHKVFSLQQDTIQQDTAELFLEIEDPLERQRKLDSIEARRFSIHFPDDDHCLYSSLFDEMAALAPGRKALHILHFGGSQIEGDRITEDLRAMLQARFGGRGPGWLPAVPYVTSRSYNIEHSDNWQRHALYGLIDSTTQHNHYGALGLYARYGEIPDSLAIDSVVTEMTEITEVTDTLHAWIRYQSRPGADANVKTFSKFTLYYGYNAQPVELKLWGNEQVLHTTTLQPSERTSVFKFALPQTRRDLRLEFTSMESPEVYGVSLESASGIHVSNISLRGQSGTHFWTQPSHQLRTMFSTSNIRLLILQFGANVVPYTTSEELIAEYCGRFGKNIEYLKKLIPGVSVLVVGPADMAYKEGTEWVSYPLLEKLRNAMQETAFESGAAYWDPYAAMGGPGKIMEWVSATPPLAANDHVHFTIDGAKKIAEWMYAAFIREYESYLEANETVE